MNMEPEVTPILMTFGDLPRLTAGARMILRRDVARAIDRAKIDSQKPIALVAILEAIRSPVTPDIGTVARNAVPSILDHLSYGFMIAADEHVMTEILGLTSRTLAMTLSDTCELAVLSGTLKDWKIIVPLGMTVRVSPSVRVVFTQIFSFFEMMGLRDIWGEYRKKSDGQTLLLENA